MANDGLPLEVVEKIIDIVGAESEKYRKIHPHS